MKELKRRTSPAASQKEENQIWGSKFSNGVYFLDNEQVKPWGSVAFRTPAEKSEVNLELFTLTLIGAGLAWMIST